MRKLPELDIFAVGGENVHVLPLVLEPVDCSDLLLYVHALQWVKLLHMRMQLGIVGVFRGFFVFGLLQVEDDESPCPIAQR